MTASKQNAWRVSFVISLCVGLLILLPSQSQAFTAALNSPTNGFCSGAPANVTLQATVNLDEGTTNSGVAFYEVTGGFIGSVLVPPYNMVNTNLSVGSYHFFAMATNSMGEICYTPTNMITVTNIPLSIGLVSPAAGYRFTAPASVLFRASVIAGSGASVRGVGFYDETNGFITNALSAPYMKTVILPAGVYQIYAVGTNSLGETALSTTNPIVITNVPFTVALTKPTNGTVLAAPAGVAFSVTVSAGSGATAQGVGYYDVTRGFLTNALVAPFDNTLVMGAGGYSVYAVATNSLGNITFSETNALTITNVPFTVSLGSPTNGSVLAAPASVALSASVVPGWGAAAQGVGFYEVTSGFLTNALSAPFTNSVVLGSGVYQIYAVATNSLAAVAFSATNTVSVTNNALAVALISPSNGVVYGVGMPIKFHARVTVGSSGAGISSVSFYAMSNSDINLLFSDTAAPYSNMVSVLSEGTYGIFAMVVNTNAQVAVSKMAMITVTNGLVVRGPYLGSRGETNINIRWRTLDGSVGRVRYGTSLSHLTAFADEAGGGTNHSVTLTGLVPETRYYYSVGTASRESIGGTNCYFTTAPRIGSMRSTRIWFITDYGEQNDEMEGVVRDLYEQYALTNGRGTDVWLSGGDNEQTWDGQDWLFQTGMFAVYSNVFEHTCMYPTPGNHDTVTNSAYWSIFDLPYHGQAGGYPSDSPRYYSFDYANVHFVSLDSFYSPTETNSALYAWLTNDLAHTKQQWKVAYFHAPIYSKAHYDSDTLPQSLAMRTNIAPVLEAYGVDVVINGHAHTLQRTSLLKGHFGLSTTFGEDFQIDGGDGRIDGTGPYRKSSGAGTVYMVAPTGSSVLRHATNPHPACIYTVNDTAGFLIFDVNTNRLDFQMVTSTGSVADYFTMFKPEPAPYFAGAPCLTNGVCTLVIQGTPDATYALQWAESPGGPWQTRRDVTVSGDGVARVQDDVSGTNRFYRLIYPQY
jgi:hypothetical protein